MGVTMAYRRLRGSSQGRPVVVALLQLLAIIYAGECQGGCRRESFVVSSGTCLMRYVLVMYTDFISCQEKNNNVGNRCFNN